MEKDRVQKYAESLERNLESNCHHLKKMVEDFREKCLLVSPEKKIPPDVITDVRELYKEIQQRITEIKAIQQLLQGKYRQYAHPNPLRDKEILELGFLAKTCHSKVEFTVMQVHAKERAKELQKAKERESHLRAEGRLPSQWFRSKENQTIFSETLRSLRRTDREPLTEAGEADRRGVAQAPEAWARSLTLFVLRGEPQLLDALEPQIQLRERDMIERYDKEELRGVLTHRKEVDSSEIESIFDRFMKSASFSKLRCLLLRITPQEDLGERVLAIRKKNLEEMVEGEMRTIAI